MAKTKADDKGLMTDFMFLLGVVGIGWGVYDVFSAGWAAIVCGVIILAITLMGAITRDS